MFTFNPDKLKTNNNLGSGRFGSVYPYQKSETDQRWVVKHIKANNSSQFKSQLENIVQSSNHDHTSILPIRGYYLQEQESGAWDLYIKMPRIKTSFKEYKEEYTKKKATIPKDHVIRYYYNLASALDYLEKKRIAHQDLKSTNVLIDENMKLYLTDVGMPKYISEEEKTKGSTELAGSELYMAPEFFTGVKPTKKNDLFKADVWSLGIVIAEIGLSKPKPISPTLLNDAKAKLVKEIIADLRKNYGQTVPDLVNASLNIDPSQRPSFADICKTLIQKYPDIAGKEKNIAVEEAKQGASAFGLFSTGAYLYKKAEDLLGTDKKKGVIERFEEKKEVKIAKAAGSFFAAKAGGLFGTKKKEENEKTETKKEEAGDVIQTSTKLADELRLETSNGFSVKPIHASNITDKKIEDIVSEIASSFKESGSNVLSINLRSCKQISDKTLKQISGFIKDHANKIHDLTLTFSECYKITDQGVHELITSISSSGEKLENLNLHFGSCHELTDQSLKEIGLVVNQSLKNLKQFTIDFRGCKKITDDGVKEVISKGCQKLTKLEQMNVDLNGCYQISDESLNYIASIFNQTKFLQKLSLEFGRCHKITDEGVKKISSKIGENLKELQHLELFFYECEQVTSQTLDSVRRDLQAITYLVV